jgi:hypothetical protein
MVASEMANIESEKGQNTFANQNYINQRLVEILQELNELQTEVVAISQKLKTAKENELRDLLQRRNYIGHRMHALQVESRMLMTGATPINLKENALEVQLSVDLSTDEDGTGQVLAEGQPLHAGQNRQQSTSAEDLALKIVRHLHGGELDQANDFFARLASSPGHLEQYMAFFQKQFSRVDKLELLLDWIIMAGPTAFTRISLIAKALEIERQIGHGDRIERIISRLRREDVTMRWGHNDRVAKFAHLGRAAVRKICALKYRDISLKRPEDLFDAAEYLSDRIDISQTLLHRLYAVSRCRSLPRADWERQVRNAFCLDHLTADLYRPSDLVSEWISGYDDLIEQTARDHAFAHINASKGMLLFTFHGGFFSLARDLYAKMVKDGLTFGMQSSGRPRMISAGENPRAALFLALRAVQDGKVMLMAPDAIWGNLSSSVTVAGRSVPVADGAAFVAYESGCDSAWFTVERRDRHFVPVVIHGPKREEKEKYADFKDRWLRFYGGQIEGVLAGDPRNIVLRARWGKSPK